MKSITIDHVTKRYGYGPSAFEALTDINLHIRDGEFFFLLGPSGCGKTTLLRTIAGLHEPTKGRILLGEKDVTDQPVEKRNTAMVFQNYALWPHMSIYQNVEFGPKMKGHGPTDRRRMADENLSLVQMQDLGKRKPNQLSGGQQQRVALARALAAEADCLLLDEPLSNLDARLRMLMRAELRRLVKSSGATAVYVTHDQKEALSMADRIAVMNQGQIVQVGTPEEVYNRPATRFVADFIGEANFLSGEVVSAGPPVEVKVGETMVHGSASGDVQAGQDVLCCVRPEWVTLQPAAGPGKDVVGNRVPARVASQMYLGEIRQYFCDLADGTQWRVSTLGEQQAVFVEDQEITLHFDPENVCIIPENS